jgi:hypothetical protein
MGSVGPTRRSGGRKRRTQKNNEGYRKRKKNGKSGTNLKALY